MIPDHRYRHRMLSWWTGRQDPPKNRRDSFNKIANKKRKARKR